MSLTARTLQSLVIFRPLLSRKPLSQLRALLSASSEDLLRLTDCYAELAAAILEQGGALNEILFEQICGDENLYTEHLRSGKGDRALLEPLLARELAILSEAGDFDGWQTRLALGDPTLPVWHHAREDFHARYLFYLNQKAIAR